MRRMWILAALAGCTVATDDDDLGEGGAHCEDTVTVVAVDEVTALGFAAAELLAVAEGEHRETFVWARGGSTGLVLDVAYDGGEARFVESEAVYPEGEEGPAIGIVCDDRVEVDVTVGFVTDDGAFDEVWQTALWGVDGGTASFSVALDPAGLGGTYEMDDDITEPDYDERSLWAEGDFDAEGARGAVAGQISGADPCEGDDCTAWAASVEVGSWGGEAE